MSSLTEVTVTSNPSDLEKYVQSRGSACRRVRAACRPFIGSNNKGPHFWDERHEMLWYTDIFQPVADAVDAGEADMHGPITCDASSNTFTVSGVNVVGNTTDEVRR